MKGNRKSGERSPTPSGRPIAALLLGLALAALLIGGSMATPSRADEGSGPDTLSPIAPEQPVRDPLAELDIFEMPSAAGEQYLMERAGLAPGPSGHFTIPEEGDRVRVYAAQGEYRATGQSDAGMTAVYPNGFEVLADEKPARE